MRGGAPATVCSVFTRPREQFRGWAIMIKRGKPSELHALVAANKQSALFHVCSAFKQCHQPGVVTVRSASCRAAQRPEGKQEPVLKICSTTSRTSRLVHHTRCFTVVLDQARGFHYVQRGRYHAARTVVHANRNQTTSPTLGAAPAKAASSLCQLSASRRTIILPCTPEQKLGARVVCDPKLELH